MKFFIGVLAIFKFLLAAAFIAAIVFVGIKLYNGVSKVGLKTTVEQIWNGPTDNTR